MEEKQDKIQEAIDAIGKMRNTAKKLAEDTQEVQSGQVSLEEKLKEPRYALFESICDVVTSFFAMPNIQDAWRDIAKTITDDTASQLMVIMGLGMVHASHQAILFYDDFLKSELDTTMEAFIQASNQNSGEISVIKSGMEVLRKHVNEVSAKMQLESINKSFI